MSTHLLCRVIITILHPIYRLWLKPRVKCKTRKPRRHMELLHNAGHLYRRLAPTCRATQSIETSRKLLAKPGEVVKKSTRQVRQWRVDACRHMVSRDPWAKFREQVSNGQSLTWPNFVAIWQKVSLVEKIMVAAEKVHTMSPDLSAIDRPYTRFYRQILCSDFGFISKILLVLYSNFANTTFVHTPSSFTQNLEMFL